MTQGNFLTTTGATGPGEGRVKKDSRESELCEIKHLPRRSTELLWQPPPPWADSTSVPTAREDQMTQVGLMTTGAVFLFLGAILIGFF